MDFDNPNDTLEYAFDTAPPYIKELVTSGRFAAFMASLEARMNLHLDIIDDVSNEILFALIGLATPNELPDNLRTEAKVPEELIAPIIDAVNREIFLPLRESLKNPQKAVPTTVAPQAPSAPAAPLASAPSYAVPSPVSVSVLPQQDARISQPFVAKAPPELTLPGAEPVLPPMLAPQQVPVQAHTSVHVYLTPPVAGQPQPTPFVQVRTMATDMEAMKAGHLPEMHPLAERPTWQPPAHTVPQPMPTPVPAAPVPAQPAASGYTRPYIPPAPRAQPEPMTPRNIGGDAYREPLE